MLGVFSIKLDGQHYHLPPNWLFLYELVFSFQLLGKPVMIITEYMENGSLDAFLRVGKCCLKILKREIL